MSKESIFGRFTDKKGGKTASLCCRVSEETRKLFEAHAKAKYGDMATGLKEILFDYMSQYPFRRQTFFIDVNIFVPIFKNDNYKGKLPYDMNIDLFSFPPKDFDDIGNVLVLDSKDYTDWKSDSFLRDTYDDVNYWIEQETDYSLDDGVVISGFLNNYLDTQVDGLYRAFPNYENTDNAHRGLFIFELMGVYCYIVFEFSIDEFNNVHVFLVESISDVSASNLAIECGNIELLNFIDSLHKGTSDIEIANEVLLKEREELLKQIAKINWKLYKPR